MIKSPKLKSNFTQIHNSVVLYAALSSIALRLYLILLALNPTTKVGNKLLMKLSGIQQEKTITKHIRELIAAGLIKATFVMGDSGRPTGFRNFELFIREDNSTKAPYPTVVNHTDVEEQSLPKQGLNNIDINLINTNNTHNNAIQDQLWSTAFDKVGIMLNDAQCTSINNWISHLNKLRGAFSVEQVNANANIIHRIITQGYDIGLIIEETMAANFAVFVTPSQKHKSKASSTQIKVPPPHQYDNPYYYYPENNDTRKKLANQIIDWYIKGLNPKKNVNNSSARLTTAEADIIARHRETCERTCGKHKAFWHDYILKNEVLSHCSLIDQEPSDALTNNLVRTLNPDFEKYLK